MGQIAIAFWFILGVATIWWPDWYCTAKRVRAFTEPELVALSPAFAKVNHALNVWSVITGGMVVGIGGVLWFTLWHNAIPAIAFILAGGAFFFPVFAHFKGVYPIPKSYRYVYQPQKLVRYIARLQMAVALFVMLLALIASIMG